MTGAFNNGVTPVATNDSYVAGRDGGQISVAAGQGVLVNDTSPASVYQRTAVLVSGPAHGTLNLGADGSFTYTPAAGYLGRDSFTYRAKELNALSNIATATIDVLAAQDISLLPGDDATTLLSTATTSYPTSALAVQNYWNWYNDGYRNSYLRFDLAGISGPVSNARIRLWPTGGTGVVNRAFVVNNDAWSENTLNWNNQPAMTDWISTFTPVSNQWVELDVTELFRQATQTGGDHVLSVGLAAIGSYLYPTTYTHAESTDTTHRPQLVYNLGQSNHAPAVTDAIADFAVDEDHDDSLIDLSGRITDQDVAGFGDSLTYTVTSNSNSTLVTPSVTGNILRLDYVANQFGNATIVVRGTDRYGQFAEDTFVVTVNSVNDTPTVSSALSDVTVDEDHAAQEINLALHFNDIETTNLTYSIPSYTGTTGLVNPSITGSTLTLAYLANKFGSGDITIRASDGSASVEDTFHLVVNSVNDLPVANPNHLDVEFPEDSAPQSVAFAGNFSDIESDVLHFTLVSTNDPDHVLNSAQIGSNNLLQLTFKPNKFGQVTIMVGADDGNLLAGQSPTLLQINIHVANVNDQHTASDGFICYPYYWSGDINHVDQPAAFSGDLTHLVQDDAYGPLQYSKGQVLDMYPAGSTLTVTSAGNFTFTPNSAITTGRTRLEFNYNVQDSDFTASAKFSVGDYAQCHGPHDYLTPYTPGGQVVGAFGAMIGGEVLINDNDDNANNVKDSSEPGSTDPDLYPLVLHQYGGELEDRPGGTHPFTGTYTLQVSGTDIKIWQYANRTGLVTSGVTQFNAHQDTTVYIEGIHVSATQGASLIKLIYGNYTSLPVAQGKITVVKHDLDTDSDNTGTVDRSLHEEVVENTAPGHLLLSNSGDQNNNGVIDYADGIQIDPALARQFELRGIPNPSGAVAAMHFTPVVLEVTSMFEKLLVSFDYSGSDPSALHFVDGNLSPAGGNLRLWTKDGNVARDPSSFAVGGDYIVPGEVYTEAQLGSLLQTSSSGRTITLYAEGINAGVSSTITVHTTSRKVFHDAHTQGNTGGVQSSAPTDVNIDDTYTDTLLFTLKAIDLDIDSNNVAGLERNEKEERIENVAALPGKFMVANFSDKNNNGVPDFADGFVIPAALVNWFEGQNFDVPAVANTNDIFVRMVVDLLNVSGSKTLKFDYSGSNPAAITVAEGVLQPAEYAYTGAEHELQSIAVQGGLATNYAATSGGFTVTDFASRVTAYAVASGRVTTITEPNPGYSQTQPVTTLSYNGDGLLTGVEDGRGSDFTLTYSNHRVSGGNNPGDGNWALTPQLLDGFGTHAVRRVSSGLIGNLEQHTGSFVEARATFTDPRHADWTYQTDVYGYSTAQAKPAFGYQGTEDVWRWNRNANGLVTTMIEPAGGAAISGTLGALTTTYGYDSHGNVTSVAYPDGTSETRQYGVFDQVSLRYDTLGRQWYSTLDSDTGNVQTIREFEQFDLLQYAGRMVGSNQSPAAAGALFIRPQPVGIEFLGSQGGAQMPWVPGLATDLALLGSARFLLLPGRFDNVARRRLRRISRMLERLGQLRFECRYARFQLRTPRALVSLFCFRHDDG